MALQKNTNLDQHGHDLPVAYHRVHAITMDAVGAQAAIRVGVYANAQARTDNKTPLAIWTFSLPVANFTSIPSDPFAWVYNWLKTQGEYDGAVDV